MSDGTCLNVSDPNTMIDQGATRNAVYKIDARGLPNGTISNFSRVKSANRQSGRLNNTFYSFGAQFTNIRNHIDNESDPKNCQVLNETMTDIKNQAKSQSQTMIVAPNATMNDYTKNISQCIFTPGVHKDVKLGRRFTKSKDKIRGIVDCSQAKQYQTKPHGFVGRVYGSLGEK